MNTQMMILLAVLCYGSFIFDTLVGKYYVISMIAYAFYSIIVLGLLIYKITIPDVNMIMLAVILTTTFLMYFIYTTYRLISRIRKYKTKENEEPEDTGGDTVLWRKIS